MVPETCPKVDAALAAAEDAIKTQTDLLRNALVTAIENTREESDRAFVAEERVAELEREKIDLEGEKIDLEGVVADLRAENARMAALLDELKEAVRVRDERIREAEAALYELS
jgi:CRISPR/Cas system CMR subunit Cmr4 (Cas7 group RAMP superfamily)